MESRREGGARWTPIFDRIPGDKKARVLYSAKREFAARGFAGANVNAIARDAGISIGALYKYFRSKEDIFLGIIEASRERIESTIDQVLAEHQGFLERVEAILRTAVESSRSDPDAVRIYGSCSSQELAALAPLLASRIEGASAARYRAMVAEAKARGEIDSPLGEGLAAFLLDDIFLALQFACGSGYYAERLRVFASLGPGAESAVGADEDALVGAALAFIAGALGATASEARKASERPSIPSSRS